MARFNSVTAVLPVLHKQRVVFHKRIAWGFLRH